MHFAEQTKHPARYVRQVRVAEIGEAGQARLAASLVVLQGQGFAREIEEMYLRLAGVPIAPLAAPSAGADAANELLPVDASSLGIENAAARDVAAGAWRALVAMRQILGI
ncbi:MAG: hypothetical protein FWD73_11270 [Polyangiaceae bacterium]|nr:hypothetical protein [Polyangiaceae bacterium]